MYTTCNEGQIAHVVDRLGVRSVPVGIESFADVISRHVYIDKTSVIGSLVERGGVTLFCRPRRFGKSLMLRMLQCYFEAPVKGWVDDRGPLFEGLSVCDQGQRVVSEKGRYPVIFLGLNACGGDTWPAMRASIARMLSYEYDRHAYLLEDGFLNGIEAARYERILAEEGTDSDIEGSVSRLATLLHRYHGEQVVILIDEYDKIVTEGHLNGYRNEATSFLRLWLTGALKGTVDLRLAALTGVQRVSKESIFSGLNNFRVNTPLDGAFSEAFGFTQPEVEALAAHMGVPDKVGQARQWYDGYNFGGYPVYNPWSVLNYFSEGACVAQPYWTNTSSNDVIRRLMARPGFELNDKLTALAEGGVVETPLDLSIVFGELDSDVSAVWSQLYLAGYATTDDVAEPNDDALLRRIRIPNLEVRRLFQRELVDRATSEAGGREALSALHAAIVSGDEPAAAAHLEGALLDSISYYDLQDENSCHMWLLALLYGVPGYRYPRSNREVGRGRPDIVLEPDAAHEGDLPAIVFEVKFVRDSLDGKLGNIASEALSEQVQARRYAHGLAGAGCVCWAAVFGVQKRVALAVDAGR